MSTAAELLPGHVVCPRCKGSGMIKAPDGDIARMWTCDTCDMQGSIPDPLITEWHDPATTPARLVELIGDGADEGKLREWQEATAKHCDCYEGSREESLNFEIQDFAELVAEVDNCGMVKVAAAFLRCLFPNPAIPREMVECQIKQSQLFHDFDETGKPHSVTCKCKGKGVIPAPLIAPLWRTSSVLDLAKAIRGSDVIQYSGSYGQVKECRMALPNNEPIAYSVLADLLIEAGAQGAAWDEMERHLRQPVHVAGKCHVIDLILNGEKNV